MAGFSRKTASSRSGSVAAISRASSVPGQQRVGLGISRVAQAVRLRLRRHASILRQAREPFPYLRLRAEADDARPEAPGPLPAVPEVAADRPRKQRLASPEGGPPRLDVVVPELHIAPHPRPRPSREP